MKSYVKSTEVYHLELNSEEYNWLKEIMQNPLHGEDLISENEAQRSLRHSFFTSLINLSKDYPQGTLEIK